MARDRPRGEAERGGSPTVKKGSVPKKNSTHSAICTLDTQYSYSKQSNASTRLRRNLCLYWRWYHSNCPGSFSDATSVNNWETKNSSLYVVDKSEELS